MECQQEGDEKEDNLPGKAFVKRQWSPLCHFNLKHSHLTLLCMDILYPVQLCPPQHYHPMVLDCPVTAYLMLSKELGSVQYPSIMPDPSYGFPSYPYPVQSFSSSPFWCLPPYGYPSMGITSPGMHPSETSAGSTGMSVSMHHPAGVMTPGPPELVSSLFYITFIAGNISVCAGCHARYVKPAVPPHDLCLRHQEWREFTLPINPAVQRRFGNTYYHPCFTCIRSRWPYTQPKDIGK